VNTFFAGLVSVIKACHALVRPYLTMFIATLYNLVLAWGALDGKLDMKDYMTSVGPINAMIIGFWFAEKAALRDPNTKNTEGKPDA
jgi:hypothetical protein